jgi:hypothetical protein
MLAGVVAVPTVIASSGGGGDLATARGLANEVESAYGEWVAHWANVQRQSDFLDAAERALNDGTLSRAAFNKAFDAAEETHDVVDDRLDAAREALVKFVLDRTIGEWVAPPTPKGVLPEWPVAGMIVDNTLWAIVQSWNDDAPTPQLHRAPIANVLTFNGA